MNSRAKYLRFSLKSLFFAVTIAAIVLGSWIVTSQMRIRELESLRDQGTIVRLICIPPQLLRSIGVDSTWPLFVEPFVVEIYVTPVEGGARLGDADAVISKEDAMTRLLEQRAEASRLGAFDTHLVMVDGPESPAFSSEWTKFGVEKFSASIGENKTRYQLRLAANRETGANISP